MSRLISVRTLTVLLTAALLATATAQAQTTWYVDDNAPNDPGPGDPSVSDPLEDGSPEHPFDAIQEGIDAATDGDTVLVADGTYTGVGNKNLDYAGKAITVRSENGPATCIVDCNYSGRGFYFHNGETTASVVDGLTVRKGEARQGSPGGASGGAIYCYESSPTIANCVVVRSNAENYELFGDAYGGGIYCNAGSPTIENCTITDCDARGILGGSGYGGGICCRGAGYPTVANCTISSCVAAASIDFGGWGCGGAIGCLDGSNPAITDCVIEDNSALTWGGGIYCEESSPTVSNCVLTENYAINYGGGAYCNRTGVFRKCRFLRNRVSGYGGGLCLSGDTATVENCWFHANEADGYCGAAGMGGAILCGADHATIVNCTITGNTAARKGGGVAVVWQSETTIANCILWDNQADVAGDQIHVGSSSSPSALTVLYSDVEGGQGGISVADGCTLNWGDGNIDGDPLFVDTANGNFRLASGSPCIDAANNTAVPAGITTDLDGLPRFVDDPGMPDTGYGDPPLVDMGAYEHRCFGDLDGDWDVDLSDLATLLGNYGTPSGAEYEDGDLDGDGDVDLADLAALLAVYGTECE